MGKEKDPQAVARAKIPKLEATRSECEMALVERQEKFDDANAAFEACTDDSKLEALQGKLNKARTKLTDAKTALENATASVNVQRRIAKLPELVMQLAEGLAAGAASQRRVSMPEAAPAPVTEDPVLIAQRQAEAEARALEEAKVLAEQQKRAAEQLEVQRLADEEARVRREQEEALREEERRAEEERQAEIAKLTAELEAQFPQRLIDANSDIDKIVEMLESYGLLRQHMLACKARLGKTEPSISIQGLEGEFQSMQLALLALNAGSIFWLNFVLHTKADSRISLDDDGARSVQKLEALLATVEEISAKPVADVEQKADKAPQLSPEATEALLGSDVELDDSDDEKSDSDNPSEGVAAKASALLGSVLLSEIEKPEDKPEDKTTDVEYLSAEEELADDEREETASPVKQVKSERKQLEPTLFADPNAAPLESEIKKTLPPRRRLTDAEVRAKMEARSKALEGGSDKATSPVADSVSVSPQKSNSPTPTPLVDKRESETVQPKLETVPAAPQSPPKAVEEKGAELSAKVAAPPPPPMPKPEDLQGASASKAGPPGGIFAKPKADAAVVKPEVAAAGGSEIETEVAGFGALQAKLAGQFGATLRRRSQIESDREGAPGPK